MKRIFVVFLLIGLVFGTVTSCQPSVPLTQGTAPFTKEGQTAQDPTQTLQQTQTLPVSQEQTTQEPPPVSTEETPDPPMTWSEAKAILEAPLDAPREGARWTYTVTEEVAAAVNCVLENYGQSGWFEEYATVLRGYFQRLDALQAEKNCLLSFETRIAPFREENGAYFVGIEKVDLFYFNDRGVTKRLDVFLDDYYGESCLVYPYALSGNSVLEEVSIRSPRKEDVREDGSLWALQVTLGEGAFSRCPSLKKIHLPDVSLTPGELATYRPKETQMQKIYVEAVEAVDRKESSTAISSVPKAEEILKRYLETPRQREDGRYEYLIRKDVAEAVHYLAYGTSYYRKEAALILIEYFQRLDELIAQTQCVLVFEVPNPPFREENGAYLGGAFGSQLLYYSDRGVVKHLYLYLLEVDSFSIAPYAFFHSQVLEELTVTGYRNVENLPTGRKGLPMETTFLSMSLSGCTSLMRINLPGNHINSEEVPRYYPGCKDISPISFWNSWPLTVQQSIYEDRIYMSEEEAVGLVEDLQYALLGDGEADKRGESCLFWPQKLVDSDPENYYVVDGVLLDYVGVGGNLVIPEGVTEIRGGVFDHCRFSILSVTFPSTLKKICSFAFKDTDLITYTFPEGLEEIEFKAFTGSTQLRFFFPLNIPENCRVAEFAFPQDWMAAYGKTHQTMPELTLPKR